MTRTSRGGSMISIAGILLALAVALLVWLVVEDYR